MRYAPRQKKRWSWKTVLPLFLFVLAAAYGIYRVCLPEEAKEEQKLTVCSLSQEKTLSALHKSFPDQIVMRDYLYYGESLALYQEAYSPENKDTLSGDTVELVNVCNGDTVSMTMENYVDQKLHLDELEPGFYEVYIMEDLVKKRAVFAEALKENTFTTVKRNGVVHRVELLADKTLLKDYGVTLDQNYLFLDVREEQPKAEEIDVLIDPYGMNMDLTWLPDKGNEANGLVENEEMYEAALLLKEHLEEYGLRVGISKVSAEEEGRAYGSDGRLAKGYRQNARYYLLLRFNSNTASPEIRGFEVHNSYYSSKTLARTIVYRMEKELNMEMSPMYTSINDPGIVTSYLMKSELDNKTIYDSNLYLRESGGRATLVGRYSETSREQNKEFKDANGMQGLEIDFGYISNEEDAALWKKDKEKIIQTLADAFAEGINVSKEK